MELERVTSPANFGGERLRVLERNALHLDPWRSAQSVRSRFAVDVGSRYLATVDLEDD
jgi:hypothetical protein